MMLRLVASLKLEALFPGDGISYGKQPMHSGIPVCLVNECQIAESLNDVGSVNNEKPRFGEMIAT